MGYKIVYQSLTELFPQIDARLLKAVAIEHPKDADEAAAVVISEIVPKFYPNLSDTSTQTPVNVPDHKVERGVKNGSEMDASSSGTNPLAVDCDHETRDPITELLINSNQLTNMIQFGDLAIQSNANIRLESGVVSEDDLHKPIYPAGMSTVTEESSRFQFRFGSLGDVEETSSGSLAGEGSAAEMSNSNLADETSKDDAELCGAFNSVVSRSTQGCNIDHLELIIEDAKSNKKTLFTVMESVMNLMREVESQEKDAEKAKEDATRGGSDILDKVEELKKLLAHAKEANDMDAGEVYGERSILTTEVNELEGRLVNLSEERDKSLAVLDEMHGVLKTRLAAALEIKNTAEQEKKGKEGSARKALAEQEVIMDKVVQESKLLQQEAEENSKLREFLMDRGRIVDSLQGEISVICQDIKLLKEKFDNRVPLSLSITSSQTSCKLASSGSSMKNLLLEKPLEPSKETPEAAASDKNKSPKSLVNKGNAKELLEEGWHMWENETDL